MTLELSTEELSRYARQMVLPELGVEGQKKLKKAKVLVVGAGGLGSPLLLYLAAAGVGSIGIIDPDQVDVSNLQRQILYAVDEAGQQKVKIAADKISQLNPNVSLTVYPEALTSHNALDIIKDFDIVVDGSDNFPTRYLVNDACVILDKPNVYASVLKFEGQVSVFNFVDAQGKRGPNYRDLFPQPPPPGLIPNCAQAGVMGSLVGIIGSMQANEVIKLITHIGDPLSGRIFLFDSKDFTTRILKITNNLPRPVIDKLIDYEAFCGFNNENKNTMKEITVEELAEWKKDGKDFQLIDVREVYEREISHIGGELIPMNTIESNIEKIDKEKDVVIYCRSGKRSRDIIQYLKENHGYQNLINLKGGILEYANYIDPNVTKY